MNFFQTYFYFTGALIYFIFWLIIFIRSSSKNEMLITGIIFAICSYLMAIFYSLNDYWKPVYINETLKIEDWLYGFIFGGLLAGVYQSTFKLKLVRIKPDIMWWYGFFCVATLVLTSVILTNLAGINSIWSLIISPLIVSIVGIFLRQDLIKAAIFTSLFSVTITLVVFLILLQLAPQMIHNFWITDNLIGIYLFKIPIEELLFACSLGFAAPVVYKFFTHTRLQS